MGLAGSFTFGKCAFHGLSNGSIERIYANHIFIERKQFEINMDYRTKNTSPAVSNWRVCKHQKVVFLAYSKHLKRFIICSVHWCVGNPWRNTRRKTTTTTNIALQLAGELVSLNKPVIISSGFFPQIIIIFFFLLARWL